MRLDGLLGSEDKRHVLRDQIEGPAAEAEELGERLAERILNSEFGFRISELDQRPFTIRTPQPTPGKPLSGKRVLVTRAREQANTLVERLVELGAEPIEFPTIQIVPPADFRPLDAAIARLQTYDWVIFTSVNGVVFFWERLAVAGLSASVLDQVQIGAIGPATAAALTERGIHVDFMPARFVAESILDTIGHVAGKRILLPRADIARETLADGLRERGALVDEIAAYRTVPAQLPPDLRDRVLGEEIDIATFTSSSTVRNFMQTLSGLDPTEVLKGTRIACIGPITAQTAQELGLRVDIVATEHTIEGLVKAILDDVVNAKR